MKKKDEHAIIRVVIATGISSVVTQLLTVREFLTQFQGNEIVIALILFNWLTLGGLGTLLASFITKRIWEATITRLGWLSLLLCGLCAIQIPAIRELRNVFFIYGSSVGFYPTWLFTFLVIAPYCLLLGFALPYSLFVLQAKNSAYPGTRIYITDNIGDISGGALFSFALVYLLTPLQAIFLSNLPLLVTVYLLFANSPKPRLAVKLVMALVCTLFVAGVFFEIKTLAPPEGKLIAYQETRYGRIGVLQDREQYTLFEDGIPVFSSQNLSLAEETIHYPMAQIDRPKNVLLISAQSGVIAELNKYALKAVDYVELDPEITRVQFQYGMVKAIPALNVIYQDGRAYLAQTEKKYDAIIVNLPEPDTYQINRFYTDRFFELAKNHLSTNGILSFAMQGFENYLAESQRQKLSSLYNTVSVYFNHVLLLPGNKVFFLCSDRPLVVDIPAVLERKGIGTDYISGFYYGNLTRERIQRLNERIDTSTPLNIDNSPHLMRLMFSQWFAKFQSSPKAFFIALFILTAIYLFRISREEFVLFSSGCMTMGCEILVIFAFQIYFGYIYLQIGIIITVFLAGLLPGAWLGNRLYHQSRRILAVADGFLIVVIAAFIAAIAFTPGRLPAAAYLLIGFAVSLACGFQFPVALYLKGQDKFSTTRIFSADLIGAAAGTLVTSVVLIPFLGIIWAAIALIGLKMISLLLIGTVKIDNL